MGKHDWMGTVALVLLVVGIGIMVGSIFLPVHATCHPHDIVHAGRIFHVACPK